MKKLLTIFMGAIFVTNIVGCGTIIYPERKGQVDGRLDAGIVALDAVGLLFFFIPGIVAFAVDFSNGTIYLPGGQSAQLTPEDKAFLKQHKQGDSIEMSAVRTVAERHHIAVPQQSSLNAVSVADTQDLPALFQRNLTRNNSVQLASVAQ
ncbi:hypothetical protein ACFODT_12450 [Vibrio zhugei]|uniref:Uncharacterized protein n=1 Tax=Vibrio zhugei TaxID=2479546 RepID=A0ABV7CCM8_9VIBR|nr:hypothetical protein [Vibrio zhugei]